VILAAFRPKSSDVGLIRVVVGVGLLPMQWNDVLVHVAGLLTSTVEYTV
jgi:hypothetical protein